jgi:hypothetical protein
LSSQLRSTELSSHGKARKVAEAKDIPAMLARAGRHVESSLASITSSLPYTTLLPELVTIPPEQAFEAAGRSGRR